MTWWAFVKRHWIMFLLALLILLGAIGGVVLGVVLSKKGDNGLIVREGNTLRWDKTQLPLPILYDRTVPNAIIAQLIEAITHIEREVGVDFFLAPMLWDCGETAPDKPVWGAVLVKPIAGAQNKGLTRHSFDAASGLIVASLVELPLAEDPYVTFAVALHELLHVVGLDHDDYQTSIMARTVHSKQQKLTDHDKEVLRDTYQ